MFGKKRAEEKQTWIRLTGADGAVLYDAPLKAYSLPEETVLQLSVEFFRDPEPCEIHRAAVHKRAMLSLMSACPAGETVAVASLPEALRGCFPAQAVSVCLREEGA